MDVFEKVHRQNLDSYKVDRIGEGTQGDIHKICVDGHAAAVKDIAGRRLVYRVLVGRWLLFKEYRIYQKLQGVPGVPKLYQRIDRDGFIFEYIDGVPLSKLAKDAPLPESFFDALEKLIQQIHGLGVVHSDLKHKKNILVSKSHQPYLVDFGASWIEAASWNFPKRWLYHQFYQVDRNAMSKIRHRFLHGNPNARDRQNLLRRNFMERCSRLYQTVYRLFSKKHKWRRRRGR